MVVRRGKGAAAQLVREVEADLVLNAIVGFAGLESTLATLETGRALGVWPTKRVWCARVRWSTRWQQGTVWASCP